MGNYRKEKKKERKTSISKETQVSHFNKLIYRPKSKGAKCAFVN